jgi:hypothetical protein
MVADLWLVSQHLSSHQMFDLLTAYVYPLHLTPPYLVLVTALNMSILLHCSVQPCSEPQHT